VYEERQTTDTGNQRPDPSHNPGDSKQDFLQTRIGAYGTTGDYEASQQK